MLSKYCKKYFQQDVNKKFKINELFDESWFKRFPLIVQFFNNKKFITILNV